MFEGMTAPPAELPGEKMLPAIEDGSLADELFG
jgi:hypothetical protein